MSFSGVRVKYQGFLLYLNFGKLYVNKKLEFLIEWAQQLNVIFSCIHEKQVVKLQEGMMERKIRKVMFESK